MEVGIKGYFDAIPHDRLMALVREHIADGRVLGLANGGTSANNTFVTITAVPEPNFAALVGGLGVLALLRRKR